MQEILVAPTDTTVLYMSRRSGLRLTMRPRYPQRDPSSGQLTGTTKGAFIGFRDGQVRIPKEGEYVAVDTLDGGESDAMPASDIHDWLLRHRLFGNREEGFWRVDPEAPPVSQDEMRALMHAAITLDADMLNEIMRQEREGWGRSDIIEQAQEALDKIQAIAEQQQAQEQPKAKPGPKPKAAPES